MKKIRTWIIERFLPAWAKETVLKENEELRRNIAELQYQIRERDAYIVGLKDSVKAMRRIIITTGGVQK